MRVEGSNSMYPIVHRAKNSYALTTVGNKVEKSHTFSIDDIYNKLIEQRDSTLPKPGKGFYIVINNPDFNSNNQNYKSTITPVQEKINKAYHPELRKETGLLVDMVV